MTEDEIRHRIEELLHFPLARALGFRMTGFEPAERRATFSFAVSQDYCNGMAMLHGGIVTTLLDMAMTATALAAGNAAVIVPTLEIKVAFLEPVLPGEVLARARAVKLGRSIGFLEAELHDACGRDLARATATVRVLPRRMEASS